MANGSCYVNIIFQIDIGVTKGSKEFKIQNEVIKSIATSIHDENKDSKFGWFGTTGAYFGHLLLTSDIDVFKKSLDGDSTVQSVLPQNVADLETYTATVQQQLKSAVILVFSNRNYDYFGNLNNHYEMLGDHFRKNGYKIVTVGVAEPGSIGYLKAIAFNPDYFTYVQSFDSLLSETENMKDLVCKKGISGGIIALISILGVLLTSLAVIFILPIFIPTMLTKFPFLSSIHNASASLFEKGKDCFGGNEVDQKEPGIDDQLSGDPCPVPDSFEPGVLIALVNNYDGNPNSTGLESPFRLAIVKYVESNASGTTSKLNVSLYEPMQGSIDILNFTYIPSKKYDFSSNQEQYWTENISAIDVKGRLSGLDKHGKLKNVDIDLLRKWFQI